MARELSLAVRISGQLAASFRGAMSAAKSGLSGLGRSGRSQAAGLLAASRAGRAACMMTGEAARSAHLSVMGCSQLALPAATAAAGQAGAAGQAAFQGVAAGAAGAESAVGRLSGRTGTLPGVTARVGDAYKATLSASENVLKGLSSGTELLTRKQKALHDYLKRTDLNAAARTRAENAMRAIGRQQVALKRNEEALNRAVERGTALAEKRGRVYADMAKLSMQGAALLAPAGMAVSTAAKKQDTIRDIAITGDMTAEDERALSQSSRDAARKFNQFQEEVLKGYQVLVAGGIDDRNDIIVYGNEMARVATTTRASMEDLGATTLALRDNLEIGGDKVKESYNIIASAGKSGQVEIPDMAKFMPQLAPMLAGAGVKGNEAVAEIASGLQIARTGAGTNDEAATNMKNYLSKIFSPDTVKNFKEAGIDLQASLVRLQKDGVGALEGSLMLTMQYMKEKSPQAAAEFKKAMSIEDAAKREQAVKRIQEAYALTDLFHDMQALNFIRPMMMHMEKYKEIKGKALKSAKEDVIGQDFDKRMASPVEKAKRMRIEFEAATEALGNALLPSALAVGESLLPLLQRGAKWIEQNQKTVITIAKVAAGFLGFKAGLIALRLGFSLFLSPAASVITKLVMFRSLTGAGLGPVRALFQAFGMAPKTAALFASGLGKVGNAVKWLGQGVLTLGKWLGGALVRGLALAGKAVFVLGRALLLNPVGLLITGLALAAFLVYKNWDTIKGWFAAGWNWLKNLGSRLRNWGREVMASIFPNGVGAAVAAGWNKVKGWFSSGWNWLKNLGPRLLEWGKALGLRLFPAGLAVKYVVENWDGIKAKFGAGLDWLRGLGPRLFQQGKELIASIFPEGGIGPALEAGWATVRAKFQGGVRWVKGLPGEFLQMGKNVAMGLVNGIRDGIGAAGDAISGMAESVKNKFKGWLGINSPSRVFAGYGLNVAEGAAIGIRNGQRQTLAASASLAASAKAGWGAPRLAPASVSGSAPRGSGWTPPSILTVPDSEARIARAQRTASSVSITFSPTVTIQGNADAKAVHEGLNLTLADLKRMLARLDHDRDRRAYV
ncbi:phage tail tape measure protein [uncultured Bilophila sp.]|uniref:phage tail tape measure protein n=1 Tax=uncultured Bilophila sp. TaxID=529385 RepID=UPI0026DD74CF|nr:phage tail tape measure protein [uncultured Bilophila sp.]